MQILRLEIVVRKIGLSRSAIYDRLDKNSPRYDMDFPKPVQLGNSKNSSIGFLESEINSWLAMQLERRKTF